MHALSSTFPFSWCHACLFTSLWLLRLMVSIWWKREPLIITIWSPVPVGVWCWSLWFLLSLLFFLFLELALNWGYFYVFPNKVLQLAFTSLVCNFYILFIFGTFPSLVYPSAQFCPAASLHVFDHWQVVSIPGVSSARLCPISYCPSPLLYTAAGVFTSQGCCCSIIAGLHFSTLKD